MDFVTKGEEDLCEILEDVGYKFSHEGLEGPKQKILELKGVRAGQV